MTLTQSLRRFASGNKIALWRSQTARIERLAQSLMSLEDHEIQQRAMALRYQSQSGTLLSKLMHEGYALVREAARRSIGMSHYPVQLLGGIAMFHDSIVVMQTGEGKTLTATLPLFLHALTGKGSHLATANDYLAARDAEIMRPVFGMLGMSVGVVTGRSSRLQRRDAYHCDVTYTTAKEIGFDFLRDRLIRRHQKFSGQNAIAAMTGQQSTDANVPVGRGLNFVLIDEADNVLIDEARTPLIVSSDPDRIAQAKLALYQWASEIVDSFEGEVDFSIDPESKSVSLTAAGRRKVRTTSQPKALSRTPLIDIYDQVEMAIYVDQNYFADRHYVVRDGEVVIVDEFTGRLAEGRKWRSGIHQAIEAREGVEISVETGEAARITIQDLFLKYNALAGMTGTVANSGPELRSIYSVNVVDVPTNKPPQRVQMPTLVFGSADKKWQAIADEVEPMLAIGRPVLIGTRSIDKSETLSDILAGRGIEHEVLNARHLDREAKIVSSAGEQGKVTIATNMAGRGTDIKLTDEARTIGGLHVICSELHDSARIDRQLIGRCGRQGDPGSFRQYLALEDDLLRSGLGQRRADSLLRHADSPAQSLARFAPLFYSAQATIERNHYQARKQLLCHDRERQKLQREMGQDPHLDTAGST
jgi:preprotein translocase subunit SecA